MITRRRFISTASISAGFLGLQSYLGAQPRVTEGYGPLVSDRNMIIDLPKGFEYQVISKAGDEMDDGLLVAARMDGMGTFLNDDGHTVLIRNHEMHPGSGLPCFGKKKQRLSQIKQEHFYDFGGGETPNPGGTSTLVYDTKAGKVLQQHHSLFGTLRNCAGGVTPWNTWISCEEIVLKAGRHPMANYICEEAHGYNFEVPMQGVADPIPLKAMGRFNHEAITVDEKSGIVYETEDRHESLFYRFIPTKKGELSAGGKLQALVINDQPGYDTRNWKGNAQRTKLGQSFTVSWLDLDDVDAPGDNLRFRGHKAGAARFARGEGIWADETGDHYFCCTNGGTFQDGQIWRYRPSPLEGSADESKQPGTLELFVEPNDKAILHAADNITASPHGGLIVCEDRSGGMIRLLGITPEGACYTFARNRAGGEFAGACFSPDGNTLFVNLQVAGMTLAITGPWQA